MCKEKKIEEKWFSITKRKDFIFLRKQGRKASKDGFFIIYRENNLSHCRFALCFSKEAGKAVQRNRFKRWARAFLKEQKQKNNIDLLLGFEKKEKHFYKNLKYIDFYDGFKQLCLHVEK